jgi:predicted enzyme related to lactoylglutathione lyase
MQHLSVVSVPVSDQERAKRFYTEQVGMQELLDARFAGGLRWIQLGFDGARTTISLVTWFESMAPGSLHGLVIDCDDLAGDYQAMLERGVPFSGPPCRSTGGVFASFRDPDGNVLSLRQSGSE